MGLFDFMRGNGKKVYDKEEEAPEKIKAHIEADNPGVKDLKVDYKDGKVSLAGTADNPEAMEKAVLLAGNVEGVEEVSTADLKAPPQTDRVEYYVIQKGDTLSAIAKQFLGNAADYPKIFEANREVIKNPNLIYPGQKIRIPLD
jgi:nucleoid-associated protein YgaU